MNAYAEGSMSRDEAISKIGEQAVPDLDYARQAVIQDVEWGLRGE